jgi:nucleotide-binding universal stress UspA family protein
MRRFKSILLYARRGSSFCAALRHATAVAAEPRALLYVVDVLPGPEEGRLSAKGIPRSRQAEVATRLRELDTLVEPACRRGVAVQVEVLLGRPLVEIIRAVLRNGHDLVVLGGEAQEGRLGDLLRRTAVHLLRDCPCAVWVVKGDQRGPYRQVLAAVDADEDWSGDQRESLRVLELAKSVAESENCDLRIVYGLGHWTSDYSVRRLGSHDSRVDQLLRRCGLSRAHHRVFIESEAVVDVVAAHCAEVDVLVMGTVWRSGPAGVLVADAAQDALARVDCSVLAVKPEGLITPPRFRGRPGGVTSRAA